MTFVVELELSLYDEAVEKFGRVLLREESSSHAIAAYGQGVALHYIAQRDLVDGKAGSAMSHIIRAIQSCENFSFSFGCTRKLLGDLHSFGALLPPDLFINNPEEDAAETISNQLEFVRKGETAYRSVRKVQTEDSSLLKAQATCDVGSNLLLQAQIRESQAHDSKETVPDIDDLYDQSRKEFQTSLEFDPLYAPAWCGLGCAVLSKDPLLAQHAFSRCIQIEQTFPDAYANIGFLYTAKKAFSPSESVMNALTQVADTPMMWMNRAFMLERDATKLLNSDGSKAVANLSQASDAYRAAMQVMKHPESQLGLALTSRVVSSKTQDKTGWTQIDSQLRKDSVAYTREYSGGSMRLQGAVSLLEGVMTVEQAFAVNDSSSWSNDLLIRGESRISKGQDTFHLNLDSMKDPALVDEASLQKESSIGETKFPVAISLQRHILHEPDRADLWLALAKELTHSARDPSTIDSAGAAASRAATMLTEELIHPRLANGRFVSCVSAPMLSDALALSDWLRRSAVSREQKSEATPEGEEGSSGTEATSSFELQRALMMDPTNAIAREALQLVS
jgi:tetratricopeptide (TPR) repeat protein